MTRESSTIAQSGDKNKVQPYIDSGGYQYGQKGSFAVSHSPENRRIGIVDGKKRDPGK